MREFGGGGGAEGRGREKYMATWFSKHGMLLAVETRKESLLETTFPIFPTCQCSPHVDVAVDIWLCSGGLTTYLLGLFPKNRELLC